MDSSNPLSDPLQITNYQNVTLTIDYNPVYEPYYYDGLVDHLSIVEWVKDSDEILQDATLVAYYSFDEDPFKDSGPNRIIGIGSSVFIQNETLLLKDTNSYFQVINSSILYGCENSSATNRFDCSFLKINSQSRLEARSFSNTKLSTTLGPIIPSNAWTHIAQTYSEDRRIRLYINGSLFNTSSAFSYRGSDSSIILRLGNAIDKEQYQGFMDEFRVYSRELTLTNVRNLSMK